jgi:excisionase family DNA binding protein
MERLLTPKEAAKIMAVSPRTIKEWLRRGEMPGLKIRNLWRIRSSDLENFIQRGNPESKIDKESLRTLPPTSREEEAMGPLTDPNELCGGKLRDEL